MPLRWKSGRKSKKQNCYPVANELVKWTPRCCVDPITKTPRSSFDAKYRNVDVEKKLR